MNFLLRHIFKFKSNTMRFVIPILSLLFLAACSSKVATPGGGTTAGGKYTEDLSVLRAKTVTPADTSKASTPSKGTDTKRDPSHYVEARHAINASLDAVLDSIDRINLNNGYVDGFTIQLYSGIRREEALDVKKQVLTSLPNLDTDVQFVQPNFRVRAGKYINRFEAQKDYMAVKKYFPNAIIIPERVPIR
jgi:hypothetical protein